jgi:hypothetical protein
VLPGPLLDSLLFIFRQKLPLESVMLVGGSALAGFYAGHRRSDDLDLFVRDEDVHFAVVKAVQALESVGAELIEGIRSAQFYKCTCLRRELAFTVDVVTDSNLFTVGRGLVVDATLSVASLDTLLAMKAATLVSRASEKDLFDLIWLFAVHPDLPLSAFLARGKSFDAGLSFESVLLSLQTARLEEHACGFGIAPEDTPRAIFEQVSALRKSLLRQLSETLHGQRTDHPLADLVREVRALKGT